MKKSERESLKKAFNIPEPERKQEFIFKYNNELKKNERKFNVPVFFRYASTIAFAVLIVGVWGHINNNTDIKINIPDTPEITDTQTISVEKTTSGTTSSISTPTAQTTYIYNSVHEDSVITEADLSPETTVPEISADTPQHNTIVSETITTPLRTSVINSTVPATTSTKVSHTTTEIHTDVENNESEPSETTRINEPTEPPLITTSTRRHEDEANFNTTMPFIPQTTTTHSAWSEQGTTTIGADSPSCINSEPPTTSTAEPSIDIDSPSCDDLVITTTSSCELNWVETVSTSESTTTTTTTTTESTSSGISGTTSSSTTTESLLNL